MSIAKAYDSWAGQYDTNLNKTRDLDQKATIESLSKLAFDTVLELGCGTGKNTAWLVKKAVEILALDFSDEMLAIAKSKINNKKVSFKKADLTLNWDVINDYADLITASLTLEHIEDLDAIFNQAYQKLKPQGKFFICELHPIKQYLGSKAKFETENGTQELEVYVHHTSEYIDTAQKNGFKLTELKEWFDSDKENVDQPAIPRLISFIFEK